MSATLKTTYASLPATTRGQPVHMGGDPKGVNFLYSCGSSIVIRSVQEPKNAELYSEHSADATVARYAPSGFYIASADVTGKVRIWDTTNAEHLLKFEYQPLSGAVKDLAWSEDSKRLVVCGDGREKYGAAFLWDSGSSVGEISGHSKSINSCDFKQTRPYRVCTASEDFSTAFFHGPPFKFQFAHKDHTRFANVVRFSPDGSFYVSGGSDGRLFLYDGKSGEKLGELGSPAHKGSVMSVAWSPDGGQLLSASADKTAKIWNVAQREEAMVFDMGSTVEDQQLGAFWQGNTLMTVALGGWLTYLDVDNPLTPLAVVYGHNKIITALAISEDRKAFYTGSYDGRVCYWNVESGVSGIFRGDAHTNQVSDMLILDGDLVTVSMDDSVRFTPAAGGEYSTPKLPLSSCPMGVGASGSVVVVAGVNAIELFRSKRKVGAVDVAWEPLCAAVSPDASCAAVGGKDGKVHLLRIDGDSLQEVQTGTGKGQVASAAFSPCGKYLATGDSGRSVLIWSVPDLKLLQSGWVFHSAKVNSVAWSPDSQYVASAGLDTNIYVWSMAAPTKKIAIKSAHVGSVTRVGWLADNMLLSTGQDAAIKAWSLVHH